MPCHARKASPSCPIRDQRRVRLGFHQSPGLGCCRSATQAQEMALSIRQNVTLGAEAAPATAKDRLRLCFLGACPPRSRARARPRCPAARRTDLDRPACRPAGAAKRPGHIRRHSGNSRGNWHQGMPIHAFQHSASTNAICACSLTLESTRQTQDSMLPLTISIILSCLL